MLESFAEIFEQEQHSRIKSNSILKGQIVRIKANTVIVSVGLKSEGVIPIEQFYNEDGELEVAEGDTVEVFLDTIENGYGETNLSREKAKRLRIWKELEKAHRDSLIVKGTISGKVKGGFIVDLVGLSAFLPGSLVDIRPVRDISHLENKKLEFKVIKLDQQRSNVVVSRRSVLELEYTAERQELIKRLKKGIVIEGTVKNLTDYGAFIDLGGVDGLLHITDMSWKRVHHPSEIVAVGDKIDVVVLEYHEDKMRVSLGLKQLGNDPWTDIERRYPVGAHVFGKVMNITDYGCFVEIEDGIEGLVHVSEMDWRNKNVHPEKVVAVGDEIEVMILGIIHERRRMSLGIKQCKPNPWEEFAAHYKKGDEITGKIKSITDFGIFVGIEGYCIDGLVHISDLAWEESSVESLRRSYKKGAEITVLVLAIDIERGRIALGVKQLESSPVYAYLNTHPKGSIVNGHIEKIYDDQFTVRLAESVTASLAFSELGDDGPGGHKVNDEVTAKLISYTRKTNTLNLSMKEILQAEETRMIEEYSADEGFASVAIGDIVKEKIDRSDEA